MPISPEQVRHVATLARIALSEDEVQQLAQDLEKIVGYVEQLSEVDTAGVEPIANVSGLQDVTRADEPGPMLPREALLAGAPMPGRTSFLVPKAVER